LQSKYDDIAKQLKDKEQELIDSELKRVRILVVNLEKYIDTERLQMQIKSNVSEYEVNQ